MAGQGENKAGLVAAGRAVKQNTPSGSCEKFLFFCSIAIKKLSVLSKGVFVVDLGETLFSFCFFFVIQTLAKK